MSTSSATLEKQTEINANETIVVNPKQWNSTFVSISISVLGLFSAIILYNNYSLNDSIIIFIIPIITVFFTTADIILSIGNYPKLSFAKVITLVLVIATLVLNIVLCCGVFGILFNIFRVDSNDLIVFCNEQKFMLLTSLFNKIGYSKINTLLVLYPLVCILQILANICRAIMFQRKIKQT